MENNSINQSQEHSGGDAVSSPRPALEQIVALDLDLEGFGCACMPSKDGRGNSLRPVQGARAQMPRKKVAKPFTRQIDWLNKGLFRTHIPV